MKMRKHTELSSLFLRSLQIQLIFAQYVRLLSGWRTSLLGRKPDVFLHLGSACRLLIQRDPDSTAGVRNASILEA
jgi:hypothetical protein